MPHLYTAIILGVIGAGTWFLTGFDKTAGGESKRNHHSTRLLRTLGVVALTLVFIWVMGSPMLGAAAGPFLIVVPLSIALILRSSLSEVFTHFFLGLIDPGGRDKRPYDPNQSQRYQDAIGHLIRNGQREQAVRLCEELKKTGEVDIVTLENTLEFLGVNQNSRRGPHPLVEAGRLRREKRLAECERALRLILTKNPADEAAALMLMRLYAEDLGQPARTNEVLGALEKQPQVNRDHLEFARRSMMEWTRGASDPSASAPPSDPEPESVDDLLARGNIGTAVEWLEKQYGANPRDFQLAVKLAEVYAVRCGNPGRAEKIINGMEKAGSFSAEQIAEARARLNQWQAGHPSAAHPQAGRS